MKYCIMYYNKEGSLIEAMNLPAGYTRYEAELEASLKLSRTKVYSSYRVLEVFI